MSDEDAITEVMFSPPCPGDSIRIRGRRGSGCSVEYADGGIILEPPPVWIPVEERLPCESDGPNIVVFNDGEPEVMTIDCLRFCVENGAFVGFTFWMPLPEPPRKENA